MEYCKIYFRNRTEVSLDNKCYLLSSSVFFFPFHFIGKKWRWEDVTQAVLSSEMCFFSVLLGKTQFLKNSKHLSSVGI